jgi:hypothetical protein
MKRGTLVLRMLAAAAMLGGVNAGPAIADSPASGAAQTCLHAMQKDYYEVVDTTPDAGPLLDFGGLVHGSDDTGTYVIAANHGECTGFVAENNKKPQGDKPVAYLKITFTQILISG